MDYNLKNRQLNSYCNTNYGSNPNPINPYQNMSSFSDPNVPFNIYPPQNRATPHGKFQTTQVDPIFKHLMDLENEIAVKIRENSSICAELEKYDAITTQLIQSHFQLVNETIEKKSKFSILKKEIDIKRNYLLSLTKQNKKDVEVSYLALMNKIERKVNGLNSVIENSNMKNEILKERSSLELFDLMNMDGGILFSLLKSSS
jgi:hypothetical protein